MLVGCLGSVAVMMQTRDREWTLWDTDFVDTRTVATIAGSNHGGVASAKRVRDSRPVV